MPKQWWLTQISCVFCWRQTLGKFRGAMWKLCEVNSCSGYLQWIEVLVNGISHVRDNPSSAIWERFTSCQGTALSAVLQMLHCWGDWIFQISKTFCCVFHPVYSLARSLTGSGLKQARNKQDSWVVLLSAFSCLIELWPHPYDGN